MSTPFLKKLRREAIASPKKAALLGLLLLAAAYFWAPLLRQWTRSPENTAESTPALAASQPLAPPGANLPPVATGSPTAAASAIAAAPPKFHWRQLAEAIQTDPLMRPLPPAAELDANRDPFVDPKPPQTVQATAEPQPPPEDEATPGELGFVLSSTIVGPARRTAVVNGKVCTLGVELASGEGRVFVVKRIEPWGVVLERGGKQFELELPRPSPETR